MPKLNVVLMIALSLAVSAGAALLALNGKGPDVQQDRLTILLRRLGDPDSDVRRDAEKELVAMGPGARGALQGAVKGEDLVLAQRAQQLLDRMTPASAAVATKGSEKQGAPDEPVSGPLELSLQVSKTALAKGEPLHFYV